ncbi:MAG TPA: hypothetical protein PK225_13190, partial [Azonexus sp.]|nr:hypothetical protein [Azonexus sp.]
MAGVAQHRRDPAELAAQFGFAAQFVPDDVDRALQSRVQIGPAPFPLIDVRKGFLISNERQLRESCAVDED